MKVSIMSNSHAFATRNSTNPDSDAAGGGGRIPLSPWRRQGQVDQILEALMGQTSNGAVIVGGPGVGKSFLAWQALEQIGDRVLTVKVHGSSIAASMPYGALRSLLNGLDEAAADNPLNVARHLGRRLTERAKGRPVV